MTTTAGEELGWQRGFGPSHTAWHATSPCAPAFSPLSLSLVPRCPAARSRSTHPVPSPPPLPGGGRQDDCIIAASTRPFLPPTAPPPHPVHTHAPGPHPLHTQAPTPPLHAHARARAPHPLHTHAPTPDRLRLRTILAVAGEDYCIIAASTRMSTGYSILTRDSSKLLQL
jgi:hypothetical protein